jgi:hypothetical protein
MLEFILFSAGVAFGYQIRRQQGNNFIERVKNYFNLYKRPVD